MTKQDFELIATVLREVEQERHITPMDDEAVMVNVRVGLASALRRTNPRFDIERFIAACMGMDSHDSAGRAVRYSQAR